MQMGYPPQFTPQWQAKLGQHRRRRQLEGRMTIEGKHPSRGALSRCFGSYEHRLGNLTMNCEEIGK